MKESRYVKLAKTMLNDLGVDLTRTGHVHYKFKSQGLMDLTVAGK